MDWNALLTPIIGTLLTALVGAGVVIINSLVARYKAKAEAEIKKINSETTAQYLTSALNQVYALASSTVSRLQKTAVDAIREAIADGKVDKSELHAIGEQAFAELKGQLSEDAKQTLQSMFNDLDLFLRSVIEEEVINLQTRLTGGTTE